MPSVWTMGEMLVEIMRPQPGIELDKPATFLGPFPSGAPAIFIDTVAQLGHPAGIIGGVGKDDFGRCLLTRLRRDGVNCDLVETFAHGSTAVAFAPISPTARANSSPTSTARRPCWPTRATPQRSRIQPTSMSWAAR